MLLRVSMTNCKEIVNHNKNILISIFRLNFGCSPQVWSASLGCSHEQRLGSGGGGGGVIKMFE